MRMQYSANMVVLSGPDGIYAASKHAIEGLTDSLRLELGHWDMSVSLIIPGQVSIDLAALRAKDAEHIVMQQLHASYSSHHKDVSPWVTWSSCCP